jgi:hypothetical protein
MMDKILSDNIEWSSEKYDRNRNKIAKKVAASSLIEPKKD